MTRYGPRSTQRSREHEATAPAGDAALIWCQAVTALWETDPEIVAEILPPPLTPAAQPLVRLTMTVVEMPGIPPFGAGWLGVAARHGDVEGEYPIFMPMTTEQSVIGGRETYGEPKKIGQVWSKLDGPVAAGTAVEAGISRLGFPLVEVRGTLGEERDPYEKDKRDFWFKFLPSAERPGELESDPLLVYGEKREQARRHHAIDGDLVLKDSPLDPIADLVIRRIVDLNWTERASTQIGKVVGPVPAAQFQPYLHQRYDDLSVLGKKD